MNRYVICNLLTYGGIVAFTVSFWWLVLNLVLRLLS
jgi:hypothetical protein